MSGSTVALATMQINSPDIFNDPSIAENGQTSSYNGDLLLTPGFDLAGSASNIAQVPIGHFTTNFEIETSTTGAANYKDFVIDGGSTSDVGADGVDAGYSNGTFSTHSLAVVINGQGDGTNSSIALAVGGERPTDFVPMTGIAPGDLSQVTLAYSDGQLSVTVNDEFNPNVFTKTYDVSVPATINADSAHVGFAGGTGDPDGNSADNGFVRNWTFSGNLVPQVTGSNAIASTSQSSFQLSNQFAQPSDNSTLTYAWNVASSPAGGPPATLTNFNTATPTAHFTKAGQYIFSVTALSSDGESTTQNVTVNVQSIATTLKIKPHAQLVKRGKHLQFSDTVLDQFGSILAGQSTAYTVTQGSGQINPTNALFTAGTKRGHVVVTATVDGLTGISGETVV